MTPKETFQELLRELFQLNNTDLDFGIYRIMNLKSKEVEDFINKQLDAKIEEVKLNLIGRRGDEIREDLAAAKEILIKHFKVDFSKYDDLAIKSDRYGQLELFAEPYQKYLTAKEKLHVLRVSEDAEKSIYNDLYRFFDRYYDSGDFVSKPRAGANNYMIPYNGEEVKLYWANYDQYYIKTGDNFKNYLFNNEANDKPTFTQVEFKIIDAETAQNNNKEEKGRLFVPTEEPLEWLPGERKLLIKFLYKVPTPEEKQKWGDKQSVKTEAKGINQKLLVEIEKFIVEAKEPELILLWEKTRANSKGVAIPLFQYHLERYTTVNKFDYFIHKDLKGFLYRELEYFLLKEVFSLQFLTKEWTDREVDEAIRVNVLKTTAIRDIALAVIDFVSELENFQKRLFEKKKFVVQSDYCITLDRIPAAVYDEIINYVLTNAEQNQIKNWKELNFIDGSELKPKNGKKKNDDDFAEALKYLKEHDKLVLDTQYLPVNLKWKLLASIDKLDEVTNGLLINSENWQALSLIEKKYKGKISFSYIDPPYNTGDDGFPYKDGFKSSSWLSMIADRLALAKKIINKNGLQFINIDFHELNHLYQLGNKIYGSENFITMFNVKVRHEARILKADKYAHEIMEQVLAYKISYQSQGLNKKEEDNTSIDDYIYTIKFLENPSETIIADGWTVEVYPNGTYKILKEEEASLDQLKSIDIRGTIMQGNSTGRIYTNYLKGLNYPDGTLFKVQDMGDDTIGYRCIKTPEGTKKNATYFQGVPKGKEDTKLVPYCTFLDDEKAFNNARKEAPVDFTNGKKPIQFLQKFIDFGSRTDGDIFIDYFGGSGSFAHAIVNYNKLKKTNHKYIIIEMGDYFITKTLPTIQKVAYSTKWSDQKPSNDGGLSQIFQYLKLEQYEDTLNNIDFYKDSPEQFSFFDRIRYQLNYATRGSDCLMNLDKFFNPFNYTMKIVQQNEPKDQVIDLVTTFNYFLGIDVIRYKIEEHDKLEYRIVFGCKGKQQYIIIWRTYDENKIDLASERDWIMKQEWYNVHAMIYCNGDNAFGANPIEPEFSRLMNEPVN